jgi:hypothetical protein
MGFLRFFTLLLLLAWPAHAQQDEIKSAISSQINAFLKDDFETAYSYAAPNIKKIFTDSGRFGAMVQNGYPMVHRPSSFRFTDYKEVSGAQFQTVLIQDQNGRFFVVEYAMLQTETGWKIKGVRVFQHPEAGV